MSFRRRGWLLLPLLGAALCGCNRAPAPKGEKLAILRFENLTGDASADWMGRAFAEVIAAGVTGAQGIEVIPAARMHAANPALGVRSISAPGISSERTMALTAGANRIGYGDYWTVNGRLQARLTIEDPEAVKTARVITASGSDVVSVANGLAAQLTAKPAPYGTSNPQALKAWVEALESTDATAIPRDLEQAIAADPDFPQPYRALAQWKAQHQDREGAVKLLEQAKALGNRIPEVDRARIEVELAGMRNDAAAQQRALGEMLKLQPKDAQGWRAFAMTAYNRRDCGEAVKAFQKVLAIDAADMNSENQLAYAAACNGDLDTAVAALRRYQAKRPNDPNAMDSMGDVYVIAGRPREAESFYLDALKQDPNFLNNLDQLKAAWARLLTGDVAGADNYAKQYTEARAAAKDPTAEQKRAEWLWVSGRRKQGYQQLEEYARKNEGGPQHELASRAYAELAIWSLMLGDRGAAAQMAQKSAPLAGPASMGLSMVVQFLAQPPASSAEWTRRAEGLFANAPQAKGIRDLTLAYALLIDRHWDAASNVLKQVYQATTPGSDEESDYLWAWALVETGHASDAAPLLRTNPVPPRSGIGPMTPFYFPRLFYLRGATGAGTENYKLFLQLSGDMPFGWGEEQKARRALGQ